MSARPTFIEEAVAALRGSVALLVGNRAAPSYFDLSLRGLAGAMIGFLAMTTLNAFLPRLLGLPVPAGLITVTLLIVLGVVALQFGICALILWQMKRLDGLVPYLVAYGWTRAAITVLAILLPLVGVGEIPLLLALGFVTIAVEINTARLIVTLSPGQIALFLLLQLVGFFVCLLIVTLLFPLPPDAAAALGMAPPQ